MFLNLPSIINHFVQCLIKCSCVSISEVSFSHLEIIPLPHYMANVCCGVCGQCLLSMQQGLSWSCPATPAEGNSFCLVGTRYWSSAPCLSLTLALLEAEKVKDWGSFGLVSFLSCPSHPVFIPSILSFSCYLLPILPLIIVKLELELFYLLYPFCP